MSFLDNLKQKALALGSQVYDQANMLDNGRTYQQRTPTNNRSVVGQMTHNGATNVTGGFAQGIAGMTGAPAAIDSTRLLLGEMTRNQGAINNATTNLARSLPQFLPVAAAMGAKTALTPVAQAIAAPYASHVANQEAARVHQLFPQTGNKAYDASVEAYAQAVKGDQLNSYLNQAGIDMNTSKADVAKRVAGQMYGGTAEAVLAGKMGIAGAPAKVLAKVGIDKAAAGSAVKEGLKEWGPLGLAQGAGTAAANPNSSNLDIIKQGAVGYGLNAGLPIAFHGAGKAAQFAQDFGIARPTNLSPVELDAVKKAAKQSGGWGDQHITPEENALIHNAQLKLGAQPGSPAGSAAMQDAVRAHNAFDVAVDQRKQAVAAMQQNFINTNRMLKENQGGYVRVPGQPTELMATHNLNADKLAHADQLGGIPQASVAIVDPAKHALDGYGDITLIGNEKLIDPNVPKTNTYASDVYSPRQPRATTQIDRVGAAKLQQKFAADSKEFGNGTMDVLGYSSPEDALHAHPGVMASFLKEKGITPQKVTPPNPAQDAFELGHLIRTNNLQKEYVDWLKEGNAYLKKNGVKEMENNADAKAAFLKSKGHDVPAPQAASPYEVQRLQRDSLRKQIEDKNLQNEYQQFINKTVDEAGATRKLYAGTTNSGAQRYVPETMDNALKLMRKEGQRGGEDMGGIGNMRSHITPKFKSIEDIVKNKGRLTDTQTMEAVKETLDSKLGDIHGKLEKYATNKSDNSFMEYDNQMGAIRDYISGGKNTQWFHQKFPGAPASAINALESFKKELQNAPTEYFESVSDRAVQLKEFEKALVPMDASKDVIKHLTDNGVQPVFYKDGERQAMLQRLMAEDNAARFPKPLDKNQGGWIKNPLAGDKFSKLEKSNQSAISKADAALAENNRIMAEVGGAAAPPSKNSLAAAPGPEGKLSRFANRTVPKSDEVSPTLQKLVKDEKVTYDPHTDAGRLAEANKWLEGKSNDTAFTQVIKSFENKKTINDQHVVNAIQTAKKLDESGNEADLHMATEIYDNLSRHLTRKGQEIQAASLLSNRTPQGLYYHALKTLRNGEVEPTPEMEKSIKAYTDKIKGLEPGSEARDYAIKELQQYVGRQIPAPMLDKMISTWKAGLLTGVKTVTGNAVSNGSFRLGHEISKPLAVAIDKGISVFTKQRSQAMTYRGAISGGGEGFQKGWQYFKTGIDERAGVSNKFLEGQGGHEVNFKNKTLGMYVNGVFRNMAAQDRPFYYSQLRTSLAELATVDGKNAGLKGRELRAHVEKTMANPTIEMMQTAKNEADRSVLAHDTSLSKGIGTLRKGINDMEPGVGRTILKAGTETTMPFTGVPSAFVSRVLDFTPVGPLKLAADRMIFKKELTQRDLTNALAEATTGTAVMWLGSELAKHNMLSGPYPNDPHEQARWKSERITPNSIKINGRWRSLNYLGPAGMLFNAGARAHDATVNGGNALDAVGSAAGGAPKDLTQQSFLQGVSTAISAVNDPQRYLTSYMNAQAGSIIPTIVNDVGSATDKFQRDRNNVLQAVEARVPGLRNTLPISNDVFGNNIEAGSNPLERMMNPLRPSTERTGPMFGEINRLQQNNVAVTPTQINKKQTFDGQSTVLTDAQRKQLQTSVGQNVQKLWTDAMKTSDYQALSDDGKKKQLDSIYQTVLEGEKRKFQAQNKLGQYADTFNGKAQNLSKDALNYMDGSLDLSKFAKEPSTNGGSGSSSGSYINVNKSVSSTTKDVLKNYNKMDTTQRNKFFDSAPDNEFKYLQAKFENDTANGTLTKAEAARAKYDLAQAKVGSSYTKEVRDLYSLNKTELYSVLANDPNGNDLANQIVSMGDQMEASGLGNNKWRDSKGNVSIAPKARTASSSSGRSSRGSGTISTASGTISMTGSLSKKAASAKVGKATFASKGSAPKGIQQYRKTTSGGGPTRVAVTKKQLKLSRSTA